MWERKRNEERGKVELPLILSNDRGLILLGYGYITTVRLYSTGLSASPLAAGLGLTLPY